MYKRRFPIYALFFCTIYSACTNNARAQVSKADSLAVFSMIDKAEAFFDESNYDSALAWCSRAEAFSKKTGFKKGQGYALIEATDIYVDKDDLVKAEQENNIVSRTGAELRDSMIVAVSRMQLAQIRMYSNKFDEAVPLFDESLRYLALHPSLYTALAYNDLGFTYGQKGDFSRQADNLLKSVSVYEKYFPQKRDEPAIALSNLSSLYYTLNKKDQAVLYGKRALAYREKSGDPDKLSLSCCNLCQYYIGTDNAEAEKYLQQCVKYALQSKKESRIIHSYVTAAYLYSNTNELLKALGYETRAIDILEKAKKDSQMLARRYMSAGTLCRTLKRDSSEVLAWYNKSLGVLMAQPNKLNLRDFYLQLSNYYYETNNNAAAFANYKRYIAYKDSLISEKTVSSVAEIAARYETVKKDDEISKLNTDQKIKQLEIEKQKAIIAGNTLVAKQKENEITLLSQQQELQNSRLLQQEEALQRQELLAKNNSQELALAKQQQQLKEKEVASQKQIKNFIILGSLALLLLAGFAFNRYQLKKKIERQAEMLGVRNDIARDLHDEIGSTLTGIRILSEVAGNNMDKDKQKAAGMIAKIREQSALMQQGMNDIVWAIKPGNDKPEEMLIRMREYAAQSAEPKNIFVSFKTGEKVLGESFSMHQRRDMFLIYKEAMNNAVKYSEATNISVEMNKAGGYLVLKISDNGRGFVIREKTSSNGLKNIRSRAEGLGGRADIHSDPGQGTQITVHIPAT